MNKKRKKEQFGEIEKALKELYREDVSIDKVFERNLDKLVDNAIKAEKLAKQEKVIKHTEKKESSNFLSTLFSKTKWQVSILSSIVGILLFGGIAYAAVPEIREIVKPTKGEIYINTEPSGAEVQIKGVEYKDFTVIGKTPVNEKLKEGEYDIKIILDDYEEYDESFTLEAGKSFNLEVKLKQNLAALDKIKEWKTYSDLKHGFEFTYPLEWELEEYSSEEDSTWWVSVKGDSSYFKLSNLMIDEKLYEQKSDLSLNGEIYSGVENPNKNFDYVILSNIASDNGTNSIFLAYYSENEGEIEIYDFIFSSLKIYDVELDNPDDEWLSFTSDDYGFEIQYPSKNWIVVEKSKSDVYAEYEVKQLSSEESSLKIIYSTGYFSILDDANFEGDILLNGYQIKKYRLESAYLYEYPDRIYIIHPDTQDYTLDDQYQKIIERFNLSGNTNTLEISDYNFMFSLTIPHNWKYSVVEEQSQSDDNQVISYSLITHDNGSLQVTKWSDFETTWDLYVDNIEKENISYRRSKVMILNQAYTRVEIWRKNNDKYQLDSIFYVTGEADPDPRNWDIDTNVSDISFVLKYTNEITVNSIENLPETYANEFLILDAVVSSIDFIE